MDSFSENMFVVNIILICYGCVILICLVNVVIMYYGKCIYLLLNGD